MFVNLQFEKVAENGFETGTTNSASNSRIESLKRTEKRHGVFQTTLPLQFKLGP